MVVGDEGIRSTLSSVDFIKSAATRTKMGGFKQTYFRAVQQAKFYLLWQALAAGAYALAARE